MRQAELERKTGETDIKLTLNLDDSGEVSIETTVPFLNHMLELFAHHGEVNLQLKASGDTEVDFHHLVEDVGITIGLALKKAVGDKAGIKRYGDQFVPMDEALIHTAVDFSGRFAFNYNLTGLNEKVGSFDTELVEEFFRAVAFNAGLNLHIRQLAGENTHHILEGGFKSFGRAIKEAVELTDSSEVPSTKGQLD